MALSEEELKAQQKYYQRSNGPVIGRRSTLSTQPNKLFKEQQEVGRIPKNFKSWADAESAFLREIEKGVKPDKAREKLGLIYRNVIGNYYFDVVKDRKTGERRGFNPRAVNEDIHPIGERDLRRVQGDAAVDNFRGQLKDGWGDYKKSAAYDPMAISAQDEARQVRSYLTSFLGRGDPRDQGMQVQRGHGFSASQSGGSTNLMDLWPELGHYNVHGHAGLAGNPRMHPDTMYEMNAADTAEAAFYNDDLDRRGLTINPRSTQWPGAVMAVDENTTQTFGRRSGQSYSMGPAIERTPGVTEAALPAQQRRRDELMAQMGRSGPRQAINEANSRSMIMDSTQSVGTPVEVIQEGIPVTPPPKEVNRTVVSPDGSTRNVKVPQATREQLATKLLNAGVDPARVEEVVDKTMPYPKKATVVPAPTQDTIAKLMPARVARNPLMRSAKALSRAIPGPMDALIPGVVGGGLALAGGATLPQAAQAFGGGVAGGLSGDLEGAPQPTVTMVNVGGELRPLNTDTNTLMDKPGYGLEQSNGQWREVQRGKGAANRQQSRVQADQLIPVPKPVMANTPTGVAQLKAMPKPKNIDLANEAQYFIINPLQKAFKNVFGNREI